MKIFKNKFLNRAALTVGTLGMIVGFSAALSAFEAHIVNVTAQIENALDVPVDAIDFGTVFPQEELDETLEISLSDSFLGEDRVDDVEYIIRQKPKCGVTAENGTVLVGPTWTGHVIPTLDDPATQEVDESAGGTAFTVDCEAEMPEGLELLPGQVPGLLPSLCEYLSKHPDGTPENDGSLNAFHQAFEVVGGEVVWTDTEGRLAKSDDDLVDTWTIDLKVPTFLGFSAQDWEDFVLGINPDADPADYVLDPSDEHKIFGCNLWIEVTEVSETPPPPTDGELVITKVVVNDDEGTSTAADFSFTVNGGISTAFEGDGTNNMVVPEGNYTVVEDAEAGYSTTYSNSLNANADCNNLAVPAGGSVTCTITNDDVEPDSTTITVTKVVINDNGGANVIGDFALSLSGVGAVTSGVANDVAPGDYEVYYSCCWRRSYLYNYQRRHRTHYYSQQTRCE
jgi:hypothetical protein